MARRPRNMDRPTWLAQRQQVWARRNRVMNALMLTAIAFVLIRYVACS